jgi:hypothetical protein
MIVNDAPSCGITYDCHSDDSRGIIYDSNMFIIPANGVNDVKLFLLIIDALIRYFQPSLIFALKTRSLPIRWSK